MIMQDGVNALHIASFAGFIDTIKVLIHYKADVDATENVNGHLCYIIASLP